MARRLSLTLLPESIAICRLEAGDPMPMWATAAPWWSITRTPDELSVVSYETAIVSGLLTPPQTTVAQPWEELGRAAVEGVISLIDGKTEKRLDALLPNTLLERESVRTRRS